jgi:hypothetical protein
LSDLLELSSALLGDAGYRTSRRSIDGQDAIVFEDATVLGFVFEYSDCQALLAGWAGDSARTVASQQFGLRRAGTKAWNTYTIFLTAGWASGAQASQLNAIEEDLIGTRKLARAAISDPSDLRRALISLLPFQAAPRLEAVDIIREIQSRTTELAPSAVEAFFSPVDVGVVLQVFEEDR